MASSPNEYTFCFINDPQFRDGGDGKLDVKSAEAVVKAINNITSSVWPEGVSCAGQAIADPIGVFVNGDLTKWGGGMQFFSMGEELDRFRKVFQKGTAKEPLKYHTYFGLGNHDLSASPADTGGVFTDNDAGRKQMWDFIRRCHVGYNTFAGSTTNFFGPIERVYSVDASVEDGNEPPDYKKYSFNYSVDLPDLHLIQLHCYGGDSRWGRAGGLQWLKDDLRKVGTKKRVAVCQHFGFKGFSMGAEDATHWTEIQKGLLLNILAPYNVIGIFHGHDHDPDKAYQLPGPITDISSVRSKEALPNVEGYLIAEDINKGQGGDYQYVTYQRGTSDPITELAVNITDRADWVPPKGFKTGEPLSFKRDGKMHYAYIYYTSGGAHPIYNLDVILGNSSDIKPTGGSGFRRLDPDLRQGSGGKYAYLCYSKDTSNLYFFDPGSVTKGSGGGSGGAMGIARVSFPVPDNGTTRLDVAYARANDDGSIAFDTGDSFTTVIGGTRAAAA
jgi:cytolysin (calcineurin-like family phosphatase)